jgi:alkanesulfonate monooxygenase SsuD/methylene tetrahydromethanopterin reductase-like flavin-dependent oxidoreductase (luciferase family)
MTDYGHDLMFGSFVTPSAERPERPVALARLSEQVGLDLVTVQDHPYQSRHLDTWTLLSVIGARTSRIALSPNVANLPLRQPVVLARSVATLDLVTNGRVELGLGAGAFWDAIAAVGGPRLSPAESVEALEEGIRIIRAIWDTGQRAVRIAGSHYRVWGAHPGPAPAHGVGIWLGAYKRRMLGLTGRLADGWLPSSTYAPPADLPAMNRTIDDAALAAGREPGEIRRLYNISGAFGREDSGFLTGAAATWAEQLAELAIEQGMSAFIVMGDDPDLLRRFAGEVAPATRELVAAARAAGQTAPAADKPPITANHPPTTTDNPPTTTDNPPATTDNPPATTSSTPATAAASNAPAAAGTMASARATALARSTVDDGRRLSPEAAWDESTRPTGPAPEPDRTYPAHGRAAGQHLVDVHDHLRAELRQLRDLIDQVTAGVAGADEVRSHIHTMTVRQNNWTVGAYCESYCRVVTTHHTLEDVSVFPHLRRADPALAPVIDRLAEEHRAIHEVLDRVDRALVAFVAGPDGAKALRTAVDLLTDALLSHLSYEERELIEPLSRLGYG